MYSCPICGAADFREGIQCRKTGAVVCMDCHRRCEYSSRNDEYMGIACDYGIKEAEGQKNELSQTRKRIEELDKLQADLYRRGYWHKAEDAVWEIVELQRKLKRLEEESA